MIDLKKEFTKAAVSAVESAVKRMPNASQPT